MRIGLRARHSEGPGPAARRVSLLAAPLGLMAAASALYFTDNPWGAGYGAGLAGFFVGALTYKVAACLPRTWRVHCRACGWQAERRAA